MKRSKSSDWGELQSPYVTLELLDFHNPPVILSRRTPISRNRKSPETPRQSRVFAERFRGFCTKSGHRPVDELHSIENKRDKFARILLTLKNKRVELNRSLTAS
jgi:hypothetical protein